MFFKKITIPRKLSEMDEEQFVEYVANDCISRLSEKDKQTLRENPDPIALHFGYGMYIRNHYIHGKRLKFMCLSSDDLSADIIERIIAKLGYKDESKVERI